LKKPDPYISKLIKEKSFKLMSNASIVSITDERGVILYANENFASISGYTVAELIGQSHNIVNSSHHPKSFWAEMWRAIAIGKVWRGEVKNKTKSGGFYWVDSQVMPVKDGQGKIVAYLSIRNDVTWEMNAAEDLQAERKVFIAGPTVAFKWRAEEGWPVEFVSSNVAALFGYSVLDFTTDKVRYSSVIHQVDLERVAAEVANCTAIGCDIFDQEYRIIRPDGECRWIRDHTIILRNEQGVATHYQGHIYDYTDRKNAREEIVLVNSRLTALIESIPDAIFFKDGDSRWLITNETAKKLFNLHEIDWYNKTEMELAGLHPDFRQAHETCLIDDEKAWQARELTVFSELIPDKSGNLLEYEVRKMPIFNNDGSRKALVIIGTDVTERKQSETELKQTKKMLEQSMRLAKTGAWEADLTNGTISWSALTKEMAEVPADYIPQLSTVLNFYKEGKSRNKIMEAVGLCQKSGVGFELEVQFVSTKGKEYWVRTMVEPKMVDGRCVKLYGYFQDISEQVELNKKNQQIEIKFSHLIDKSTDAIVLQDAEGVILYCSPAIERILGYTPEEVIGISAFSIFHPDDIAQVEHKRIKILDSPGEPFPIVTDRLRHKDGHYVYVEGTVTNMFDDETVMAAVANFRDVTEKRLAEENLKLKNERLEQIAWLFSHQVRGPVATILGLVNLFNHQDKTDPINEQVLAKVLIPAHQLDEIISQIVQKTNELDLV
jgi:PAS domain S-box-containing protein